MHFNIKHVAGEIAAQLYRGIGHLIVETARGEVKACAGDLILHFVEGDKAVLTPRQALTLFGTSARAHLAENLAISLEEALALTPESHQALLSSAAQDVDGQGLLALGSSSQEPSSPSSTASSVPSGAEPVSNLLTGTFTPSPGQVIDDRTDAQKALDEAAVIDAAAKAAATSAAPTTPTTEPVK